MSRQSRDHLSRPPTRIRSCVVLLVVIVLAATGCSILGLRRPKGVVSQFWSALEQNDQDTMLDCIEPSLRASLDPFSRVVPPGIDWLSTGLDWLQRETGMKVLELGKMSYEELDNDGSTAHVRVYGRVKLSEDVPWVGGVVREFQLTQTLVREAGAWYLTSPQ